MKTENKLITLDDFNVDALAEIKGKKQLQQKLVKANPYIEITDNASWELAKKSRTALRTGRTDLEKEKKTVLGKIKEVISEPVSKAYDSFIAISQPHEDKQQTEVKRYEDIKENERLERERLEEERKQRHRDAIQSFFNLNKSAIESLTYEDSKTFELEPKIDGEVVSAEYFENFQDLYEGKLEVLKIQLNEKKKFLQDREDLRIEKEKFDLITKRKQTLIDSGFSFDGNNYFVSDFKRLDPQTILMLSDSDFDEIVKAGVSELARLKEIEDASKRKLLQDQEQLRIDREAVEKQKRENLIGLRKNELISLGFDKDGAYDADGVKIIVSEVDMLADVAEWTDFIISTKERIEIAKIPVVIEEETLVSTEPEIANTEVEDVSTESFISEVDYEENIPAPTKEQLQQLLKDYVDTAEYDSLLELCRDLFLIKE